MIVLSLSSWERPRRQVQGSERGSPPPHARRRRGGGSPVPVPRAWPPHLVLQVEGGLGDRVLHVDLALLLALPQLRQLLLNVVHADPAAQRMPGSPAGSPPAQCRARPSGVEGVDRGLGPARAGSPQPCLARGGAQRAVAGEAWPAESIPFQLPLGTESKAPFGGAAGVEVALQVVLVLSCFRNLGNSHQQLELDEGSQKSRHAPGQRGCGLTKACTHLPGGWELGGGGRGQERGQDSPLT